MNRLGYHTALVCVLVLAPASSGVAQSVLHRPLGVNNYQPSTIAAAADGSFYVADEATQTIQRFDARGQLLSTFGSPAQGNAKDVTGMAVDSFGNLHVGWSVVSTEGIAFTNGASGLAKFSPSGEVLSNQSLGNYGLHDLSIGAGDQIYLLGSSAISTFNGGVLTKIAQPRSSWSRRHLEMGADNRLYLQTWSNSGTLVDIYETTGTRLTTFSVANPLLPDAEVTAFAVAPNGIYTTDTLSGTVRRYSSAGSLLGVGYGVPRAVDLAVSPSGSLLAAMPQNRVVESITEERFAADYAGVTLVSESRRQMAASPYWPGGGISVSQGWTESAAGTFIVSGMPGEMVDVGLKYVTGSNSVITVFPVASVTADPTTDPMEYMSQAMEHGLAHLDLSRGPSCASGPGCQGDEALLDTISVEAGTEIGFLHLPSRWDYPGVRSGFWVGYLGETYLERSRQLAIATFDDLGQLSDAMFAAVMTRNFDEYPNGPLPTLQPIASDARANWGRLDQFGFFVGEDATLLVMEDLSLAGFSDLSYHDATLLIDTKLLPFVEPGSGVTGDYNVDGVVDAADYTVWRDHVGEVYLPNRDPAATGAIGEADYQAWVSNYGSSAASSATSSVPEPTSALLCLIAAAVGNARRGRTGR